MQQLTGLRIPETAEIFRLGQVSRLPGPPLQNGSGNMRRGNIFISANKTQAGARKRSGG